MLIEDSPADIRLIKRQFGIAAPDCTFVVCKDGEAAIRHLKRLDEDNKDAFPDLIILDMNLPKRNGLEVLKTIKGGREN